MLGRSIMVVTAGLLAACAQPTQTVMDQDPVATVEADTAAAQALLSPDETLKPLTVPKGGTIDVRGAVQGYKSNAYAVPVAAGDTLEVAFEPSNANLYFNVVDVADQSGAAVFRGEVEGNTATVQASVGTTYLVRPFQPRAMARRGEVGQYDLKVTRR